MTLFPRVAAPLVAALVATSPVSLPAGEPPATFLVADAPTHALSPLLFGQFLERFAERSSGGELGPQAALVPGSPKAELQPGVLEAMRSLRATTLRFPGGGALEGIADWTVMIDHSPFRETAGRARGYAFGWEEFFGLCRDLRAEPVVVVNFRSAVWGEKTPLPPEEMAAGLVAYCNLPQGTKLPAGMPDWPAIRARNGHPEPHGVRYFQLGNEWVAWLFATNTVQEKLGRPTLTDEQLSARLRGRAADMLRAMRAVDPSIKIIVDAVLFRESDDTIIKEFLNDPEIRKLADFAAVHHYRPWEAKTFTLNGSPVALDDLTPNQLWFATVGSPDVDEQGFSTLRHRSWDYARAAGWEIVMTEWNWNGWGVERHGCTPWARGLGVAGYLHAIFRSAAHIHLAHQSMMIGNQWFITAIRVTPDGSVPPFLVPSGQVTAFYAAHAGDRFVPVTAANVPAVPQPVSMGSVSAAPKLALVEAVATESDGRLTVHLVNRDPAHPREVQVALGAARQARLTADPAKLHRLEGPSWNAEKEPFLSPAASARVVLPEDVNPGSDADGGAGFRVTLPPASIAALEIPLRPAGEMNP